MKHISVNVDGTQYEGEVEPRTLLVHWLRNDLGKVGTVVGCDTSNCGACTVLLDGRSVKSCSVLAVQADGAASPRSRACRPETNGTPCRRHSRNATACSAATARPAWSCRPSISSARTPTPRRRRSARASKGNLCRCTGYHNIVRSVEKAAELMGGAK